MWLKCAGKPETYAARLYAALHQLEAAGAESIVFALPPHTARWLAVREQPRRASRIDEIQ